MSSNLVIPNSSLSSSFCKNKIITAYLTDNPVPCLSHLSSPVNPFFLWHISENPDTNSSYVFASKKRIHSFNWQILVCPWAANIVMLYNT